MRERELVQGSDAGVTREGDATPGSSRGGGGGYTLGARKTYVNWQYSCRTAFRGNRALHTGGGGVGGGAHAADVHRDSTCSLHVHPNPSTPLPLFAQVILSCESRKETLPARTCLDARPARHFSLFFLRTGEDSSARLERERKRGEFCISPNVT